MLIACLFHSVYDVTVVWVLAMLPLPPGATRVGMVGLAGVALVIVLLAGPRLSYTRQQAWVDADDSRGVGMRTRVERINPSLDVQDLPASIRYYVDVLGFAVYVETQTLGIVESDGHQIHLRKGGPDSSPARVWLGVEDAAVLHEQYRARNARIIQKPTNYTWAYQMMVEDLDGNLHVFGAAPLEDEPFRDRDGLGTGQP